MRCDFTIVILFMILFLVLIVTHFSFKMNRLFYKILIALFLLPQPSCFIFACSKVVRVRQNMDLATVFATKDTKYLIKDDINLGGCTVKIGDNCTLIFDGGSLSNGTIVGHHTKVKAPNYEIFKRGRTRYRAYVTKNHNGRFPPFLIKEYRDCLIIEGTWSNHNCGSNWTGLLNKSNEDVMLAVMNFVRIHEDGVEVKFPTFDALGYEKGVIPGNHIIDFNYSTISYPSDLSIWEDTNIAIPNDAMPCALESGYGLLTVNSNTTIAHLTIDGKSTFRQNEKLKLGVSNIICIGNSQYVVFDSVNLYNVLGPAMVAHPKSKNLTFRNCRFVNIGEHILYSQQYLGYCHFEGCIFDTWDSERLSVFRNGTNYLYKHTPLQEANGATYEELYNFELTFSNCIFNNPKRVNSQGRTLGGFITCDFPISVTIDNCTFLGAAMKFNPGGDPAISEKSGKANKMIVRNCNGAPYAYSSEANCNIITEFYDCINIPFRVVYARRYENCKLNIDLYEDSFENVSGSFEKEFMEPLVIKNCEFTDNGNDVLINHPILHRPVIFEKCNFLSVAKRNNSDLIRISTDNIQSVSFDSCVFNLPGFRLVGGLKKIQELRIKDCEFRHIERDFLKITPRMRVLKNNKGVDLQ